MALRKSVRVSAGFLSVSACMVSLSASFSVDAALSGGRYLTPAETVELLGSQLEITYYNGSENVVTTASYIGSDTAYNVESFQSSDYLQNGLVTCVYSFTGSVVNDPSYVAVNFTPNYGLFDVDQFYTVIGCSASNYGGISNATYQTPQWIWNVGGQRTVYEGRADYGLLYRVPLAHDLAYGTDFCYVEASFSGQSRISAISERALFSFATDSDGTYYIAVGCPYITFDGYGSAASTSATTATTGNGGGTVDMRETNGILGTISQTLSGIGDSILNGIAAIFVPRDDFVQHRIDSINQRFDVFRSISQTWDTVKGAIQAQNWANAPTVTVNMKNRSESGYGFDYGGTSVVLDMSWYKDYKPLCDTIISAFLWLFFIWRLYARLPDIISGAGMVYMKMDDMPNRMKDEKG